VTRAARFAFAAIICLAVVLAGLALRAQSGQATATLPSGPLTYGFLSATFSPDGTFAMSGSGWPPLKGTWKASSGEVEFVVQNAPSGCTEPGKYRYRVEGHELGFELVKDDCQSRRMMIGGSTWFPAGEKPVIPPRKIIRTAATPRRTPPAATPATGSWPSFRGAQAAGVGDGQNLPDTWDGK
jgi:hypothetical protein